jgi:hypothetical protein
VDQGACDFRHDLPASVLGECVSEGRETPGGANGSWGSELQTLFEDLMPKTIGELIKCAEREVAMRRNVYPKWIVQKRMTEEKAAWELAAMEEIAQVLRVLSTLPQVDLGKPAPAEELI